MGSSLLAFSVGLSAINGDIWFFILYLLESLVVNQNFLKLQAINRIRG